MNKEQIKYLLKAQESFPLPKGIARDIGVPFDTGKILSLIGVRRVGKTFLLMQRIQELLSAGVDRRQIIYINFEDDRITPIKGHELDLILQAHGELYPQLQDKKRYYFFDEIQNAPGWERFCRRIYDTEKASIVLTGSSSHFLAKEIATELRGRSIAVEVFPLSFAEFLHFRGIKYEEFSMRSAQRIKAELEIYLQTGGLPEVVLAQEALRPYILKEYTDLIFYKDLLDRYKITNPIVMKEILRFCLSSPASLINAAKIFQDLKSRGLKIAKDTVYRYLDILEESYILFYLPIADRSLRKRSINPKKMHPIDWSLGYSYITEAMLDRGRKLETAIFLHERRKVSDLGFVIKPNEIDLVVSLEHPKKFINVCWSLGSKTTLDRELFPLINLKVPKAEKILIAHEEANKALAPKGIQIVEAWRYLLQDQA
jgi:predicted AAA+ superfamily ATPase